MINPRQLMCNVYSITTNQTAIIAMWNAGLKVPTQVADGRARCFCGAAIETADSEQHVLEAHMIQVGC